MASIVTNLTCELTAPVSVVFLPGNMFSMDNGGNIINVFVVQNGEPVALGGSVSANVIRSDGTTVAITGALEGNKAYIILPQACYAVPGIIHIVMKITEGTTITTIAAITANVYQSSTDAVVDPGTLVPSIAALIEAIEDAVDSIPVDYSGLLATLAADYSTSKTYKVGDYAWYGGVLKRCIVAITTAESYTAAHWTNAVIGDDLSALKSAFDSTIADITEGTKQLFDKLDYKIINAYASGGSLSAMNSARYLIFDIPETTEATKITVHKGISTSRFSVNSFANTKENVGVGSSYTAGVADISASTLTLTCPTGTKSVGIWFASSSDSASTIENFPASLMVQYGEEFTGYEAYLAPVGVQEVKEDAVRLALTGRVHVSGSNLITNSIQIVLGDGWSGNLSDGFTHTSGSEGVIQFVLGSVENLAPYYVDFDVNNSADVENALLIAQGLESNYSDTYTANTHRVGAFAGLNNNNATLYIKAIASLNVTITNIRCYRVGTDDDPYFQLPYYGNAFNENGGFGDNVTGFWNIAIGENTLKSNLMGSRNLALGYASLMKIKYGTRNIGVGTFSLSEMQHGEHNVAIGADSIYRTAFPSDNIGIGYSVMAKQTSSSIKENVAIGTYALHDQPDGANGNVAIGNRAGYRASVDNTFVGNRAGYSSRGQGNVAIGRGALEQLWNTGNYNVVVGYNAGVNAGTEENPNTVNRSIAIGYKAKATKERQAMIGSDEVTEVVFCGNKKINFNNDGTVTWETLT